MPKKNITTKESKKNTIRDGDGLQSIEPQDFGLVVQIGHMPEFTSIWSPGSSFAQFMIAMKFKHRESKTLQPLILSQIRTIYDGGNTIRDGDGHN